MTTKPFNVPIIDLSGTHSANGRAIDAVTTVLRAAGRDVGMFYVTNHDVPEQLLTAHFDFARSFFALDVRDKRAIDVSRSNCFRGYTAFGTQTIDEAAPGDLKEGFIMGPDLLADHPHVRARYPNTGTNLWPHGVPGLRHHMEAYVDAMNELGRRLAGLLALSLDLPKHYFSALLAEPLTYSQLLHYPSLPSDRIHGLGAGAHVDWGMLTILLQDDVGGLEIYEPGAGWHATVPVPNAFVVILGEMMIRLTDGQYRSAKHRVQKNASGRSRYAMPTFFDPGYDARIACVPTCRPPLGNPRYPACTVAQHMQAMARETLSGL